MHNFDALMSKRSLSIRGGGKCYCYSTGVPQQGMFINKLLLQETTSLFVGNSPLFLFLFLYYLYSCAFLPMWLVSFLTEICKKLFTFVRVKSFQPNFCHVWLWFLPYVLCYFQIFSFTSWSYFWHYNYYTNRTSCSCIT